VEHSLLTDAETRMKKSAEALRQELVKIRTGKASTALVAGIKVDYFGTLTPLNQAASITTPEARLLVIQPWDKSLLPKIEKEILKSDLGLTPVNDGTFIRLAIPALTEERRKELVKLVRKYAEEARVAIRNVRRDANEHLKREQKDGKISEDDLKKHQIRCQELTDKHIETIDDILKKKEEEIMEV